MDPDSNAQPEKVANATSSDTKTEETTPPRGLALSPSRRASPGDSNATITDSQVSSPRDGTLSPASSVGSTGSRHSKNAVVQALAAARRKKAMSPSSRPDYLTPGGKLDSGALNLPTLTQESRNDKELNRTVVDILLVQEDSQDGELEVSLKAPPLPNSNPHPYRPAPSATQSPTQMTSTSLASSKSATTQSKSAQTEIDRIILEARKASSLQPSDSSSMPNKKIGGDSTMFRDHIVQQALDRASAQSRAAAVEALSSGSSAISQSESGGGLNQVLPASILKKDNASFLQDTHQPISPPSNQSQIKDDPITPRDELSPIQSPQSACLSPTVSEVGSIDDFETAVNRLPSKLLDLENISRQKMLRRIDGEIASPVSARTEGSVEVPQQQLQQQPPLPTSPEESSNQDATESTKKVKTVVISSSPERKRDDSGMTAWLNYFFNTEEQEAADAQKSPFGLQTSILEITSSDLQESFVEAISTHHVPDPRMPDWIGNQTVARPPIPNDGTYRLSTSRTVLVHEIMRDGWTWCTAWSPDGKRLAIGTENHHLAVIETTNSSVWRVKHDKRVKTTPRQDTVQSIRSIAWGPQFIAIGGIGNAVSILAPTQPYPILHTITKTGFCGCLDWWQHGSNTLLIGSRLGKALVVKISVHEKHTAVDPHHREIQSTVVHTVDRDKAWVNSVKFSPGGTAFAVGDSKGILGVYSYQEDLGTGDVKVTNLANFKLEDAILSVDWSPGGDWLYAGGEDFAITVISTPTWQACHRIKRDRWVQFIASSRGGSHIAVGGVSSEVSILDVDDEWKPSITVGLKGLVPLSGQWHPQDQYLVLTGQNNSVLAVETTNARYVIGHCLRSVSPILAIEFSPNARFVAIGNEAGIITIFKLSGTTFVTTYELVVDCAGSLSIKWSKNSKFLAISTGSKVVIIDRSDAINSNTPSAASGFSVARVIRDMEVVNDVAIDSHSRHVAISGSKTQILDSRDGFKCIKEMKSDGVVMLNSWSPDGKWFATAADNNQLLVYDSVSKNLSDWKVIFTVQTQQPLLALAWGTSSYGGLQYCAFGGKDKMVYIMEIRTKERTWETVLGIPRDGVIYDLDWNQQGLVAAAIGDGTVTIMDLSYLHSGVAVNEMDYNWQRQALTCFTEVRRNQGKNSMRTVRWIPARSGTDSLLAVGGTDGEVEILDLTKRAECSGYAKPAEASRV